MDISPNKSLLFEGFGNRGGSFQWVDFYASYTDRMNYMQSVNDEFKKVPYLRQKYNEMIDGMHRLQFNNLYSLAGTASVGTYDSDCGCFPIDRSNWHSSLVEIKQVGNNELAFGNSFINIGIGKFFNYDDLDNAIKMRVTDAEKFINSRKDNNGRNKSRSDSKGDL